MNFNCSRFVYNHFLALRKQVYEEQNKTVNFFECSKLLTELKHTAGYEWLNESDSYCLIQSLRDLDAAYKNFFRRIKNHQPPYGFPQISLEEWKANI